MIDLVKLLFLIFARRVRLVRYFLYIIIAGYRISMFRELPENGPAFHSYFVQQYDFQKSSSPNRPPY